MSLTLSLLLLIVAAVLAGVAIFQSPRSVLAWAVLVLCIALLIPTVR
jgi:hypothetical protein